MEIPALPNWHCAQIEPMTYSYQPYIDRSAGEMTLLPATFILDQHDVLCGRGNNCFRHAGNQQFRKLVHDCLEYYTKAPTKAEKTLIIREIISVVRGERQVGGFVKYDPSSGRYYEISDKLAREKTSQAFRDALYGENKSSGLGKTIRKVSRNELFSNLRHVNNNEWKDICSKQSNEVTQQCQPETPSSANVVSYTTLDFKCPVPDSIITPNASSNADYSNWFPRFDMKSRIKTHIMNNLFTDASRQQTHALDSDQAHVVPVKETNECFDHEPQPVVFNSQEYLTCNDILSNCDETIKQLDTIMNDTSSYEAEHSSFSLTPQNIRADDNNVSTTTSCAIDKEAKFINQTRSNRRSSLDWENLQYVKTSHDWWLASQDDPFER